MPTRPTAARLAAREIGTGRKYADQAPAFMGRRNRLSVARLQHGGRWYLGRRYRPWHVLGRDLKERLGITVEEQDPIAAGKEIPSATSLEISLSER